METEDRKLVRLWFAMGLEVECLPDWEIWSSPTWLPCPREDSLAAYQAISFRLKPPVDEPSVEPE